MGCFTAVSDIRALPSGGLFIMRTVASGLAAAFLFLPFTQALADVPAIKTSARNQVDACVTPGRLTAFLRSRNERLDPRFNHIAIEYMRHGEQLGLRWDYTFYQMLLETGNLSFRGRNGRPGDVSPRQNNFAGLGATGKGAPGESFPDVATGVLAHLQHVLVYAGETVENPVADRTRKVQEWGVLKSMQRSAKGHVTFRHLAAKWAPGSVYVSNLESIAASFHRSFCRTPDPHPEWVAEARGEAATKAARRTEPAPPTAGDTRISGVELARRAIAESQASDGVLHRSGLGVPPTRYGAAPPGPAYSILNAPAATADPEPATASGDMPSAGATTTIASAAGSIAATPPSGSSATKGKTGSPAATGPGQCRVWTASYGGQRAMIIRVKSDSGTDFTVLDVNEGAEKREAAAYIAAYAKGGVIEAEFPTSSQALEKAFELCPEG
jgi:hypothetical protein